MKLICSLFPWRYTPASCFCVHLSWTLCWVSTLLVSLSSKIHPSKFFSFPSFRFLSSLSLWFLSWSLFSGISFVFPVWLLLQYSTDIANLDLNRIILITQSCHNSTEFHFGYFLPLLPTSCLHICHALELQFLKNSCWSTSQLTPPILLFSCCFFFLNSQGSLQQAVHKPGG